MSQLPIATQWVQNAVAPHAYQALSSIVMIVVRTTGQKGTGWLVSDQRIVSNEHVVRGGSPADTLIQFVDGSIQSPTHIASDQFTDLAVLTLPSSSRFAPLKIDRSPMEIGTRLCAWGHPLGYNGPPPLLTVGYLAGFNAHLPQGASVPQKRLVINAALNPGNSGGPIAAWGETTVRGVVASKHAPITPYLLSAIDALSKNASGVTFTATDNQGNTKMLFESQLVAEILLYFRSMTQVVIGEAISPDDLVDFLNANSVPWVHP